MYCFMHSPHSRPHKNSTQENVVGERTWAHESVEHGSMHIGKHQLALALAALTDSLPNSSTSCQISLLNSTHSHRKTE